MHLPVPYFSQYRDVKDPEWRFRSCSIVNLKMILEYMKQEYPDRGITAPSVEELIKEGVELKGHSNEVGWRHDAVAMLARNHGCNAYREEFRSRDAAVEKRLCGEGVEKIRYTIETGFPVIVSVLPGFSVNKDFHTVLFTGIHDEGFHYHDPASENEALGANQFVSEERFLEFWRKFAIFVY